MSTDLLTEARVAFERDRDVARARELVDRAIATMTERSAKLCGRIAARLVMLGDRERAVPFALEAVELEASGSPIVLGTRHMFCAKLLHELRRWRDAAQHASEGARLYALGCPDDDNPELAFVRADAARIIASYSTEP